MVLRVFVTGGAGFIGSHAVVDFMRAGWEVAVFDDFSNSSSLMVSRIPEITGRRPELFIGDVRYPWKGLVGALDQFRPDVVVHFAGKKSVAESVEDPLLYASVNVEGTINLLKAMEAVGCRKLVFSSSATVYDASVSGAFTEESPLGPASPYGWSKLHVEQMLEQVAATGRWDISVLRYFNPAGCHPSGRIGELPMDVPANLFPVITDVLQGKREKLLIFGDDYDTLDGTGVRDYVHVCDLAEAHRKAILKLRPGIETFNLGSGSGYSVRQVVKAFERATRRKLPVEVVPRRPGDVAVSRADATKARHRLGWRANLSLDAMAEDSVRFTRQIKRVAQLS